MRRDRPFSEEQSRRRVAVDLAFANGAPIITAEDAILSKLDWARGAGDSDRLADAADVLALNSDLDRAYVEHWARLAARDDEHPAS